MSNNWVPFGSSTASELLMDVRWIHGVPRRRRSNEPPIQVHWVDPHSVILRQSKCVSYEAPFMYLLFGNERAVLFDTGATADPSSFPLRATVDELMAVWLTDHPRADYELIVAHSHGHNDHVAADRQFVDRAATTVVGRELDAVQRYFGFTSWPEQVVRLDLGGRVLEIIGTPGHHRAAITVYDRWTGFLLTGDTVLPGRLYAFDYPAFLDSLDRIATLTSGRRVVHVLGCHIEMTSMPGKDYPLGATYQPQERALQMTVSQLLDVRKAAQAVANRRGRSGFEDFIIYNEPRRRDQLGLLSRGLLHRALPRFTTS
jgi:hydroxyacylglutathione hydrolase